MLGKAFQKLGEVKNQLLENGQKGFVSVKGMVDRGSETVMSIAESKMSGRHTRKQQKRSIES